jgi:hypothetical protein
MLLSLATSLLVMISIPFLIVVDHKRGADYAALPSGEVRVRRDSNILHNTKYTGFTEPPEEISECQYIFLSFHCTCQPLQAAEAHDGPSTETSSLLSAPGDIITDDAASKKSAHSHHADVTGLALLSRPDFWQLWVLMGLLTGVGLMTIK